MPNVESYKPGLFCWIELATTDPAAARAFYGQLFGWSVQDIPMGENGVYTIYQLEGRDAAAGYKLRPDQQGVPPHWMLYVSVENVDAAAAKVAGLGGKVVMGPFDVMDAGRMAVIVDPTGAMCSLWQGKNNPGIGIAAVHGTLCWADLITGDTAKAKAFYEGLFGWKISTSPNDPSGYLHIQNGEEFIGGMPPSNVNPPGMPPHWVPYFYVNDCDASAAAASAAGGNVHMGPMTIEKVGRMAIVGDPAGAVFAIFKNIPH